MGKCFQGKLSKDGFWFAPLSHETGELDLEQIEVGENREQRARKDLAEWLSRVGLPYHSPHKFRHGFAVFALKHADNIGQLKAISQNLMHANISITDGIYGGLSDSDISKQISSLTKKGLNEDIKSVKHLLKSTLKRIEELEENGFTNE